MTGKEVLAGFVGDLLVDRENPIEVFSEVSDLLTFPDILFGNLEGPYTDSPHMAPSARTPVFPRAWNLDVFSTVGFKVLSLANNHICDAGHAALIETKARLNAQGIATCGAGDNLAAAREPAIVQVGDLKIAFLAYASVFPMGYEARLRIPGLAPFRAYDVLRPKLESYHAPGIAVPIQTVPDDTDLENLRQDIARARDRADIVISSFHWGDYARPYHLTDHETRTARWCIDQGVDMVVGHHHHVLRGMEWYRNKPIMYGLGHFVFDIRFEEDPSDLRRARLSGKSEDEIGYEVAPRKGWPLLPLHPDARMTALAWARITRGGVHDIGFLPCNLTSDGLVHALDPLSQEGQQVIRYMTSCIETQQLNGSIELEDAIKFAGRPTIRIVRRR